MTSAFTLVGMIYVITLISPASRPWPSPFRRFSSFYRIYTGTDSGRGWTKVKKVETLRCRSYRRFWVHYAS